MAAPFRAGYAEVVLTPDPLLPVSGGVGPSKAARVKHGELLATVMAFESGGERVVFVGVDFLGFPSVLGNRVRSRVTSVKPGNILIGASHTHSAPDCYAFPDGQGGTSADLAYLDRTCVSIAEAIERAVSGLTPARLKVATGEARGKIAYNYYADRLYDPRCHVIQAVGLDGKALATLVNYAIHPEVIGASRGVCSPDLVGPLRDRVRELGGGAGLFMNGAQGGMVTADNRAEGGGERNDWEECRRIGRLLAEEAMRVVKEAPEQEDPELACWSRPLEFTIESPLMRAILKGSPLKYPERTDGKLATQLNVVHLGGAQILTIPGEALPNIGYYLKRNMRGEHNFLFGLTNDAFGYLLTKVDWGSFKIYDYVSRTSLGEMAGETYMEEALKLVRELPAPRKTRSSPANR
ncbi:MAG: hypothetical protein FJ404_01940 [Verrucomicrobia bacterium]|nr:hypothetical protein [Verrucomicrobiota bacterium]